MKNPKIKVDYQTKKFESICDRCMIQWECFWWNTLPIANLHFIQECEYFKEGTK